MIPSFSVPAASEADADDDDDAVPVTRLHYANHPFASVSRALQENVAAHFSKLESQNHVDNDEQASSAESESEALSKKA